MIHVGLVEPTSFLDYMYLICTQRDCNPNEGLLDEYRKMFESRFSAGETQELPGWERDLTRRQ